MERVTPVTGPRRRTALRGLAALTAFGTASYALGGTATAKTTKPVKPATTAAVTPQPAATDPGVHLLRRATFGLTPSLLADLTRMGREAWLEAQLAPSSLADPVSDLVATRLPKLAWTTAKVRSKYATPSGDLLEDLLASTAARAVWSTRQLQEVMVDLWSNHLNVPVGNADLWATRHTYDGVIRAGALGSFSDLLYAAITHPAMLQNLNADRSTVRGINENLGRELLEMHTVGAGAGYSQHDVVDSARILTGLGQGDNGLLLYRLADHATGAVSVLGFTHANKEKHGLPVVQAYLAYLARHPATARRIATRLAVRFVADVPPATLVDRLTQVYLDNDTQIVPVLRALFASAEFAAAAGLKARRPYEDLYATVRVTDLAPAAVGIAGWRSLVALARLIGHVPLTYPTPDGYPDVADAYSSPSFQLGRFNLHQVLPWGALAEFPTPGSYVSGPLTTMGAAVDAVAARFLSCPLTAAHRTAVLTFLGRGADEDVSSWSWRQVEWLVAPLLLDSPYFTNR